MDVGFSLRALGAVEALSDGTIMVREPIKPITYDFVSNPSHATAKVLEFLPETLTDFLPDQTAIYESGDLESLRIDGVNLVINSNLLTEEFLDMLFQSKFQSIISKNIRFSI